MRKYYPLSQPQQRIWLTQNIYPSSCMFNIGGTVMIEGSIDVALLKNAIRAFLKAHDAFSIRIIAQNQMPAQYFDTDDPIVYYKDFSGNEDARQQYACWEKEQAFACFELLNSPLYNFTVFKLSDTSYGYFIKLHHLIADGLSFQLLTYGIEENYKLLKANQPLHQTETCSYLAYIKDEQEYLASEKYVRDKKFWNKLFSAPESFPTANRYIDGQRNTFFLTESQSSEIRWLCTQHGVTTNSFFISAYILYALEKLGRNTVSIGIPVLGRIGIKQRKTIGMFVSTMPFLFQCQRQQTVIDLLRAVDASLKNGYLHQRYPYNHFVNDLHLQDGSLYDMCINYYGTAMQNRFDGYVTENKEFFNGQQAYGLQIIIREWSDQSTFQLDFDTLNSLYSPSKIQDLVTHYIEQIDAMLHTPTMEIGAGDQRTLPDAYQVQAVTGEGGGTVLSLFEAQVRATPDRIAVECEGETLTYQELYRQAQKICTLLSNNNVQRFSIVGLLISHSIRTLPTILGVLKYGCAFLPIQPGTPASRVDYMLWDAGVTHLLTDIDAPQPLKWNATVCSLKEMKLNALEAPAEDNFSPSPKSLAYVLYTSGSTGKPKGVIVTHANLYNYVNWAKKQYAARAEKFALYTSLGFDLTVTTLFTPLVSGGEIIVYPDNQEEYVLFRIIKDNRCTVIKLTPSHLSLIKNIKVPNSCIKQFIVGGEDLKSSLAKQVQENYGKSTVIINEYGPTEATVGCMIHRFDAARDTALSVPIGVPADNTRIYLLNEARQKVPVGEPGELYIAGDSVALGYLNRPELTNQCFIDASLDDKNMRLYRTGDMAKFIDEKTMVYLGRWDSQVKIRGHRIELLEIEAVLSNYHDVQEARVIKLDFKGDGYLCAYYTAKCKCQDHDLRNHMSQQVPSYMIPSFFIQLPSFPLTNNGKLDVARLPSPEFKNDISAKQIPETETSDLYTVAASILHVNAIAPNDNFYKLGGDSIKAIQISSKLRELGLQLSVKHILENPTFTDMDQYIVVHNKQETDQSCCEGDIISTPIVDWFFNCKFQNPDAYCQNIRFIFNRPISLNYITLILKELIWHHDILRVNVRGRKQLFYNNDHLNETIQVEEHDLRGFPENEWREKAAQNERALLEKMDLSKNLLISSCLLHIDTGAVWCVMMHHLAVDFVSLRIFTEDVQTALRQALRGQTIILPSKTASNQAWAAYFQKKLIQENLYSVYPKSIALLPKSANVYRFDADFIQSLTETSNTYYSAKLVEILLAGLLRTLAAVSGCFSWFVLIEGHGRDSDVEIEISRTMGWFTKFLGESIDVKASELQKLIPQCKEFYRKILKENQFNLSLYQKNAAKKRTIRFNFLSEYQTDYELFAVEPVFPINNEMTETVEFAAMISNGDLFVCLRVRDDFDGGSGEEFVNCFAKSMEEIAAFCLSQNEIHITPSDFPETAISQQELDMLFSDIE